MKFLVEVKSIDGTKKMVLTSNGHPDIIAPTMGLEGVFGFDVFGRLTFEPHPGSAIKIKGIALPFKPWRAAYACPLPSIPVKREKASREFSLA